MSNTQIKQMYLQQLELTKNLKTEENCLKVLEIGRNIISENKESECITGTYVNMAVAKRVLFALLHKKVN